MSAISLTLLDISFFSAVSIVLVLATASTEAKTINIKSEMTVMISSSNESYLIHPSFKIKIPCKFCADLLLPGLLTVFSNHKFIAASGLKSSIDEPSNFIIQQSDRVDSFSNVLWSDLTTFICVNHLSHATLLAGILSIKSKRLSTQP